MFDDFVGICCVVDSIVDEFGISILGCKLSLCEIIVSCCVWYWVILVWGRCLFVIVDVVV